jgi:putative PIN family toxin of toxin-antitoxin system
MRKNRLCFVFDANVIVSASLDEYSTSANAFYQAIDDGTILLSKETLREISEVIRRDKFDRYVTRSGRERFLKRLVQEANLIEPIVHIHECRDPDDDKYLELAVDRMANCIVSGDKDLLVLNPFRDIPIMRPDQFLRWLPEDKG